MTNKNNTVVYTGVTNNLKKRIYQQMTAIMSFTAIMSLRAEGEAIP